MGVRVSSLYNEGNTVLLLVWLFMICFTPSKQSKLLWRGKLINAICVLCGKADVKRATIFI